MYISLPHGFQSRQSVSGSQLHSRESWSRMAICKLPCWLPTRNINEEASKGGCKFLLKVASTAFSPEDPATGFNSPTPNYPHSIMHTLPSHASQRLPSVSPMAPAHTPCSLPGTPASSRLTTCNPCLMTVGNEGCQDCPH